MTLLVGVYNFKSEAQSGGGIPTAVGNGFAAAGFAAGYFETGYRLSANQTYKYGQNIDGKIRPAKTLTRANRISSNAAVRGLSKVGTGLAFASAGVTIYDAYSKGEWQNHHTADLLISGAIYGAALAFPIVGWVVGGLYFAADVTSQISTGKTLTENLFDH
jgi:hypothetical protein